MLQSKGEQFLIWGDTVSVPAVQGLLPQVGFAPDVQVELVRDAPVIQLPASDLCSKALNYNI